MFLSLQTEMHPAPGGGEEAGGFVRTIKSVKMEHWEPVEEENAGINGGANAATMASHDQKQERLNFDYLIELNNEVHTRSYQRDCFILY